jgi:hypothetical protein
VVLVRDAFAEDTVHGDAVTRDKYEAEDFASDLCEDMSLQHHTKACHCGSTR